MIVNFSFFSFVGRYSALELDKDKDGENFQISIFCQAWFLQI